MESFPHPDWAVITALGGPTKVASMLGATAQTVQNWKTRGIPARVKLRHPDLFLRELPEPAEKARTV